MRTLLTALIAILFLSTTVGCFETDAERRDSNKQQKEQAIQTYVDGIRQRIKDEVIYVADPRTGICFAAFNHRPDNNWATAGFAPVPCEQIPPELLYR